METAKRCIWCDKPLYCGDDIVELTDCDHIFHEACFERWFKRLHRDANGCYVDARCPDCDEELQSLDPSISTVYWCPKSFNDDDHNEDNCCDENDDYEEDEDDENDENEANNMVV